MDQRDSFVFYRSFFEAISQLDKNDQAEVFGAICDYALNGTERPLSGISAAMFLLVKPNLDANQRKYENGKKGGRPKSGDTAKGNQGETKGKPKYNHESTGEEPNVGCLMYDEDVDADVDEDEGGGTAEKMISFPSSRTAVATYLAKVNPTASQRSIEELDTYERSIGTDICLRAIDIALDNRAPRWSYIKAILQRWAESGVKCLADIDALEEQRERGKAMDGRKYGATKPQPGKPGEADQRAREDMERMRRKMAEMGGAV